MGRTRPAPEGDPCGALERLRRSGRRWRDLGAPYERARVRVLQGRCCAALGDDDEARLEFDSAASIFHGLHALPDLRELRVPELADAPNGLTPREVQVLRAVATGRTKSSHRPRVRHQREDGGPAPEQHIHQARRVLTSSGDGLCVRASPALTGRTAHTPPPSIARSSRRGRRTAVANVVGVVPSLRGVVMTVHSAPQQIDTVVIGAGQAGPVRRLPSGSSRSSVPHRRHEPTHRRQLALPLELLRLYSPAGYDGLPGMPFPGDPTPLPHQGRAR